MVPKKGKKRLLYFVVAVRQLLRGPAPLPPMLSPPVGPVSGPGPGSLLLAVDQLGLVLAAALLLLLRLADRLWFRRPVELSVVRQIWLLLAAMSLLASAFLSSVTAASILAVSSAADFACEVLFGAFSCVDEAVCGVACFGFFFLLAVLLSELVCFSD